MITAQTTKSKHTKPHAVIPNIFAVLRDEDEAHFCEILRSIKLDVVPKSQKKHGRLRVAVMSESETSLVA